MRALLILALVFGGCVHDDLDQYYARWIDHVNFMHDAEISKLSREVAILAISSEKELLSSTYKCGERDCWAEWAEAIPVRYSYAGEAGPVYCTGGKCLLRDFVKYETSLRERHNSYIGEQAADAVAKIENSRKLDLLMVEREKRRDQQMAAMQFQNTMNSLNTMTNTLNNFKQQDQIRALDSRQGSLEDKQKQ